jgi:RNA polymerase sigma factor (sigma-70 family)
VIQGGSRAEEESRPTSDAARKRAAIELIARHEATLKRTARRYSIDAEDAEDAFQRAMEIVLTKAPTTDARDLIRWTQTVTKHEALAVRHHREKLLGYPAGRDRDGVPLDPVASIPAGGDGPDEQAERRETVARTREALRALKPAELRSLTLLAEGYSYAEISEITGFSPTKINRCLAEGRDRFRALLAGSEDGSRCRELRPLLSAFCDDEASPTEAAAVREHLRACARCRATMRTYRAAPRVAAAFFPALPPSRSLPGRVHDLLNGLGSRLGGIGGSDPATQVAAAGGTRGAGMVALAKLLAVCAGAAGGAAVCVASGVLPAPLEIASDHTRAVTIERVAGRPAEAGTAGEAVQYQPAANPARHPPAKQPQEDSVTEAASTGAVEYEAPPAVPASAPSESGAESTTPSGSAAGEFGP